MDRNYCLCYAQLCEQAELYDEMVEIMLQRCEIKEELDEKERNLLSVAFKNVVGRLRASHRLISSVNVKNLSDGIKCEIAKRLLEKVSDELKKNCTTLDKLIGDKLLPLATTAENKVFLHKLRGDYHRYRCEVSNTQERDELAKLANKCYTDATAIASELEPHNPIRLGLALNFSVFHYEIMSDSTSACTLAQKAFDDAIQTFDSQQMDQPTDSCKDSTLIMQLLKDNLTLWTSDFNNADEMYGDN